jgi:transposase-like protein
MSGKSPYSPEFRADVLAALRAAPDSVAAVARAYELSPQTVAKWAREDGVRLPSPDERMALGSSRGGASSMRTKWGDWEKRRKKARALRAKGWTLDEIANKLGYSTEAGVSYAVRETEEGAK